ncbi:unnamed protein product [Oncorhynchus mykiss]|nr:unnamed protein product [Oncorhynchus mykiss]
MQLMELAILNGTYRDANIKQPTMAFSLASSQQPRLISSPSPVMQQAMRSPAPGQQPNLMPHLIRQIQSQQALMQGANQHAALMQQSPESGGFFYAPYEYSPYTLTPSILEYPMDTTGVLGKHRYTDTLIQTDNYSMKLLVLTAGTSSFLTSAVALCSLI